MAQYQQVIALLDQWGFRDLFIPFAIIFTLVFALFQKLQIFKAKKADGSEEQKADKKISTILALGISAASLIPHFTGQGPDVVVFINNYLPNSFLLIFVVLLFLALIGSVGGKVTGKDNPLVGLIAIASVFVLVLILLQSTQTINYPFLNFLNDPNTQAIAIVILVFGLVIWYISSTEKTDEERKKIPLTKLKEALGKILGG